MYLWLTISRISKFVRQIRYFYIFFAQILFIISLCLKFAGFLTKIYIMVVICLVIIVYCMTIVFLMQ